MDREILFRAKAINRDPDREYRTNYKNGDWVYGLITKPYNERFPKLPAEMRNTDGVNGIEVDYKTIGMWTGKLDCEENYIFENDILQDIDTGEYVVVQWFPEHSSACYYCNFCISVYYNCYNIHFLIWTGNT